MAHPGRHALERPDGTALVDASTGKVQTWRELHAGAVNAANTLHGLGVRPGDSVAFCVENRFEFSHLLWGCVYSGIRYTPVSTRLTPDEIDHIVGDCGARVLVHSTRTAPACGRAAERGIEVVDIDVPGALGTDSDPSPVYERVEGIAMLYSSGTTGKPKGVWRPAPPEPIEEIPPGDAMSAKAYGIGPSSVYLSTAPLYHSAPITFLVQMGRIGATTVVMDRFDALESLRFIEEHSVTHSQWVPTMFIRLLRLSDAERARHDLSSHVWAIHGAGPCPIHVKERMLEWWGPIIHEYYAGTEGAGMCTIGPSEWLTHKGSVGRSVRGPIHIVDENGNDLPAGEIGQIWFENSSDFRYLNDSDKTAEARGAKGTGTFGDIGYVDADGYLYLTDRKSFTINTGGINVYPREIEDVLIRHPAVHDVAVFGVPNEEYGEEVKAVVQPVAGTIADSNLVDDLMAHCRESLATFKLPRTIDFIEEMPREPTGKLRTGLLRERWL